MLKDVHNASMKEVKGLEDRLYGLDLIISGARKIVHQQSELAQVFLRSHGISTSRIMYESAPNTSGEKK